MILGYLPYIPSVVVGVMLGAIVGMVAGVASGVGALVGVGVSVAAGVATAVALAVGVTVIVGVMATVGVTVASKGQNVCVGVLLTTAAGVAVGETALCCTGAGLRLLFMVGVMVIADVMGGAGRVGTRGGTLASTRGRSATAATLGIDCKFFIEFVDNASIC